MNGSFRLAIISLCALGLATVATADVITFEDLTEGDAVGTVVTMTNAVTFSVGSGAGAGDAYVHAFGTAGPGRTAFAPDDTVNTADPNFDGGALFIADEDTSNEALESRLPYNFAFAMAVSSLTLDLYDFRLDGGAVPGDTLTLQAYANSDFTGALTSTVVAVPNTADNGSFLQISVGGVSFLSAQLIHSGSDVGTGVDNVAFETEVPEPGTLLLLGAGLTLVGLARRRRRA